MATPQEEMTSLEVVKLIEAEADEEGDILEELTNQDIKEIYQQLNQQDKKRFRQFRKFHRQYFGVYGEHLPSYHMARQVVKDLMPGLPSASADVIAEKRSELLARDRLRELCRKHGFKFPEREMRMEAPREEAAEDPTYRFLSVQDEYQAGLTTTTEEEIGQLLGPNYWNSNQSPLTPRLLIPDPKDRSPQSSKLNREKISNQLCRQPCSAKRDSYSGRGWEMRSSSSPESQKGTTRWPRTITMSKLPRRL